MCGENSLVDSEYGMCVYGKKFGLYRVCVSFTLCWLSLQGGLPDFKGFIGKVVYLPASVSPLVGRGRCYE